MKRPDADQAIRELVAKWPPLSREQKDKLRILLKPAVAK